MSFQVLRRVGNDNYPNGTFETFKAAEAVARHVKEFHGAGSRIVIQGPDGSVDFDAPLAVDAETGTNASEEQRTETVGVRRQRRKVGKKAPLRHARKVAGKSRQETQEEIQEAPEEALQGAMSG